MPENIRDEPSPNLTLTMNHLAWIIRHGNEKRRAVLDPVSASVYVPDTVDKVLYYSSDEEVEKIRLEDRDEDQPSRRT